MPCFKVLVFSLIMDRHKIGLATFINLFLLGYVVEFSQAQCARLFPTPGVGVRAILFLVGLVILCLSSALYFTADLGVSTYDAVALVWSERQSRIPFQFCRIITDSVCVFGSVGIGTVVTAFFMGPLIAFFNRTVARPLLGSAER